MAAGAGGNVIYGLLWLLILVFISWWVASFCFVPFVVVSVLTPCFDFLRGLSDLLLQGVMLPHTCSENMINMKSL